MWWFDGVSEKGAESPESSKKHERHGVMRPGFAHARATLIPRVIPRVVPRVFRAVAGCSLTLGAVVTFASPAAAAAPSPAPASPAAAAAATWLTEQLSAGR